MQTPNTGALQATTGGGDGGLSNTTVAAILAFFLALAGVGYFLLQKSKSAASTAKLPTVNPSATRTLPTVAPGSKTSAGSAVSGLLTDPALFKGLMGLSSTIAGLVTSNKKTVDATPDSLSPTGYVDSEGSPVNKDGSDYTGNGKFSDPGSSNSASIDLQEMVDKTL